MARLNFANIQPLFHSEHLLFTSSLLLQDVTYQYAKDCRLPTKGKIGRINKLYDGNLKVNCLHLNELISCDRFESRLKGYTYTSYGKTTSDQYVANCIFVGHMSGYVHAEYQLCFSSSGTIRATLNFEQLALDNGVAI